MKQQALLDEPRTKEYVDDTKVRIELPYPPTVNHSTQYRIQFPSKASMAEAFNGDWGKFWRWLRGKSFVQTYKTQETKDFFQHVWACVNRLGARKKWAHELKVTMIIHPPDRRRRDSSNLWKITEDSLQAAGVFEDDSQIKEHHAIMSSPVPGGLVVVEIEVLV